MGLLPPPPPDDEGGRSSGAAERRTDLPPLDVSRPLGIVVPDDLTGLEAEIRAVQEELGTRPPRNRRDRLRRWLLRRAGVRHGLDAAHPAPAGLARSLLVGPVVAVVLLMVAGLVALFPPAPTQPSRRGGSAPPRLATPRQPPGSVGGLLPDTQLVIAGTDTAGDPAGPARGVSSRSLRPAVLMLVPDRCACRRLVHEVIGQVEEYPGLSAALVGSGRDAAVATSAQARDGGNGRLPALADRDEVLARAYHADQPGGAPTLLFIAADGLLTQPPLVFLPGSRIESAILPLVSPVR